MAPRKLILHRLTAHFGGRIRQNQRLLSSHFYSFTALEEAPSSSSSSSSPNLDGVYMTDTCVQVLFLSLCFRIDVWGFVGFSFLVVNLGFLRWYGNPVFRVCEKVSVCFLLCAKKTNARNWTDEFDVCILVLVLNWLYYARFYIEHPFSGVLLRNWDFASQFYWCCYMLYLLGCFS